MKFPPLGVDEAGITVASLERETERERVYSKSIGKH